MKGGEWRVEDGGWRVEGGDMSCGAKSDLVRGRVRGEG